jgi:hypothetical protein
MAGMPGRNRPELRPRRSSRSTSYLCIVRASEALNIKRCRDISGGRGIRIAQLDEPACRGEGVEAVPTASAHS